MSQRHRWREHFRDLHKTERVCTNQDCQIVMVTRHEAAANPPHWVEFWCDADRVECDRRPACPYPSSLRGVSPQEQIQKAT